jgi:hypothetical protein
LFRRFFLSQDDTFVVVFAFVRFRVNGGEVGCFKEKEQYMNILCGASGGVTQGPPPSAALLSQCAAISPR